MTKSTGRTRQGLNRLRRGAGSGEVQGYLDAGSVPQAVRGDEDGPWVKGPPFITNREGLYEQYESSGTTYRFTPDVNVRDYRILTLFIDAYSCLANGQLSLIPEFSMDDVGDNFYPIGVVEAAITQVNLPDTNIPFEPPFGSRTFYPTELRSPVLAASDDLHTSLTFDVGSYNRYRFGVAWLSSGGADPIILSYNLSM
jgi:hypothetical protein